MIQWIVFDVMGVIFGDGDDVKNLLIPFIHQRKPEANAEFLHATYRLASLGLISSFEFWKRAGLEEEYPAVETKYLDTCLKMNPQFLEVAGPLGSRFRLAILSNDVKEWSAYVRRKFGLDRLFQVAVISGEVGVRKPAAEIYRILLDRLQAKAEDCIFIDDRLPNLLISKTLGIIPVWLAKENPPPDPEIPQRIQNLSELPDLIENNFSNT